MMGSESLVLAPNLYPYWLPEGIEQRILWIADREAPHSELVKFITAASAKLGYLPHDLVMFERPLGNKTKLVKGTLPQIRHLHYWSLAK